LTEPKSLFAALDEVMADDPQQRHEVFNHEERAPISSLVWSLVFRRDRGRCWICGHDAYEPVLDHLRPRSNWPADELWLADRSDNLHVACWDCNEERSNRVYAAPPKVVPVTTHCGRCSLEWIGHDVGRGVACFCSQCGFSETGEGARLL
jgi:hypothetical protein